MNSFRKILRPSRYNRGLTVDVVLNFEVTFVVKNSWGTGGTGTITIKNNGSPVTNWSFNLTTTNFVINDLWAMSKDGTGNNITVKPPSWKTTINNGETIFSDFGYSGSEFFDARSTTTGITLVLPDNHGDNPDGPELKSDKVIFAL